MTLSEAIVQRAVFDDLRDLICRPEVECVWAKNETGYFSEWLRLSVADLEHNVVSCWRHGFAVRLIVRVTGHPFLEGAARCTVERGSFSWVSYIPTAQVGPHLQLDFHAVPKFEPAHGMFDSASRRVFQSWGEVIRLPEHVWREIQL